MTRLQHTCTQEFMIKHGNQANLIENLGPLLTFSTTTFSPEFKAMIKHGNQANLIENLGTLRTSRSWALRAPCVELLNSYKCLLFQYMYVEIALCFPRLSVCLFVCASALITCAILRHTLLCNCSLLAAFGGLWAKLQQASVVVCCLYGEKVVGGRVFVTHSC